MDPAKVLAVALLAVAVTAAAAGVPGAPGIAPGVHRRLDAAGFSSPQEDDFFADYKDLVTPPKDLLETPKDLLETPKDLLETPEDLVESPKDLTDTPKDLLNEDLEDYAQHGSSGAQHEEDDVDVTHPSEDDTAAHDENAERSLAKHLKAIDIEGGSDYDHDAPAKTYYGEEAPAKTEYYGEQETPSKAPFYGEETPPAKATYFGGGAPAKTAYYGQGSPAKTAYYGQGAPAKTAYYGAGAPAKTAYFGVAKTPSPYSQAGARSPYVAASPAKAAFKDFKAYKAPAPVRESFPGPAASLRSGYSFDHGEARAARPEYAYRYGVHDPTTRDVKSAWEQRDGEDTRGGYAVMEPDGHTRVVEYSVTKKGGFNARVKHLPPGHHGR